jgi:hypothetical protein
MIIKEVSTMRDEFQDVSLIHEKIEANAEAHRLARAATTLGFGRRIWFLNPLAEVGIPLRLCLVLECCED